MVKIVKFDPSLPTLEGDTMAHVYKIEKIGKGGLPWAVHTKQGLKWFRTLKEARTFREEALKTGKEIHIARLNERARMPLEQEQIDEIIRRNRGSNAVTEMLADDKVQIYELSDGNHMLVSKRSGRGRIETPAGEILRIF